MRDREKVHCQIGKPWMLREYLLFHLLLCAFSDVSHCTIELNDTTLLKMSDRERYNVTQGNGTMSNKEKIQCETRRRYV